MPTFYPGATDLVGASPIHLTAGSEVTGLQIKLARGRTVSVRGRVVGTNLQRRTGENPSVSLTPRYFPSRSQGVPLQSDGSFRFIGVTPGAYRLSVSLMNTIIRELPSGQSIHGSAYYAWQELYVGNQDLDDLVIAPAQLATMSGTLMKNGPAADPVPVPDVRVGLIPDDGFAGASEMFQ